MYGWASEKMPWMVIHMAIPMTLLAGVGLAALLDRLPLAGARARRLGLGALAGLLAAAAAGTGIARLNAAGGLGAAAAILGGTAQLPAVQAYLQGAGRVVLAVVLLYGAWRALRPLGAAAAARAAAAVGVVVLAVLFIRTSWVANFYNGDVAVEMLVYTQTTPDVGKVMAEIDRLAFLTGTGTDKVKVVYDSGVSWPFEWYLRDYKGRVFIGAGNVAPKDMDAPVILVGVENNREQAIKQQLGAKYVSQRYRLRWWFPEDYRELGVRTVADLVTNADTRAKLWRYLMFRETAHPLGSTDFVMFVRRDLAGGVWAAPQTAAAASGSDLEELYSRAARPLTAAQSVGGARGAAAGQLAEPKAVAVAPSGLVYVADTMNHRVQVFDKDGKAVRQFGAEGTAAGQFNQPWGIAIAPTGDVYVADTWNHRVQRFGADGTFKQQWGGQRLVERPTDAPGQFFGPRGIAVNARGEVYVADTGSHRVQKFDADGKFLSAFGGRGAGDGVFDEPTGVALDKAGNVYVADAWNHRVQKLDPNGKFLAQWPVAGWASQSIVNKPGVVVDADGAVYVTDPEAARVVKLSASGQVRTVFGKPGNDAAGLNLPTGLALGPTGDLYVADAGNHRVQRFAAVN
jgi:DNA-binding beta-propeller fold protein YncE